MKALLSVSFGTSHALAREKTIGVIDAKLAEAFPDRAFFAAWASGFIVRKVCKERGDSHDTLDEAFERLSAASTDLAGNGADSWKACLRHAELRPVLSCAALESMRVSAT